MAIVQTVLARFALWGALMYLWFAGHELPRWVAPDRLSDAISAAVCVCLAGGILGWMIRQAVTSLRPVPFRK
jgi:hypothetical protein